MLRCTQWVAGRGEVQANTPVCNVCWSLSWPTHDVVDGIGAGGGRWNVAQHERQDVLEEWRGREAEANAWAGLAPGWEEWLAMRSALERDDRERTGQHHSRHDGLLDHDWDLVGHTWRNVPFHGSRYDPFTGEPTRPYMQGVATRPGLAVLTINGGQPIVQVQPYAEWATGPRAPLVLSAGDVLRATGAPPVTIERSGVYDVTFRYGYLGVLRLGDQSRFGTGSGLFGIDGL